MSRQQETHLTLVLIQIWYTVKDFWMKSLRLQDKQGQL